MSQFCGRTRREMLWEMGGGFGSVALTALLGNSFFAGTANAEGEKKPVNPLAPKAPPFPAKAKSVIFLFMYGGPSQVDTFDYKPELYKLDGKTIAVKTFGRGGKKNEGRVVGPKWAFKQYGQCGKYVSDLFPNLARHVDDIAFLHSMTADSPIHGSAMLQMNTGKILSGSPCLDNSAPIHSDQLCIVAFTIRRSHCAVFFKTKLSDGLLVGEKTSVLSSD